MADSNLEDNARAVKPSGRAHRGTGADVTCERCGAQYHINHVDSRYRRICAACRTTDGVVRYPQVPERPSAEGFVILTVGQHTALVPLGDGNYAILDTECLPLVAGVRWRAYRKKGENTAYVRGRKGRQQMSMHRVVMEGAAPPVVDHRNRNGLDNRRCNLRAASNRTNTLNSRTFIEGRVSGTRRAGCKWQAQIGVMGKKVYLGLYETKEQAEAAYRGAAKVSAVILDAGVEGCQ